MLAIVLALCPTRAQAWSHNLEEFTISTYDIQPDSISISGDFVTWRGRDWMGYYKFFGYNLPTKQQFVIYPDEIDYWTVSNNGNFVVWKTMSPYWDFRGYNLSTKQEFVICPNDVEPASINLSKNSDYVVWKDITDMKLYGCDLSTTEEFVVCPNNVDPISISIGGDFVVWRDNTDMKFYGYDLSTKEEFVICPNNVEPTSISNNSNFVVWKDLMDGKLYSCDLSTKEKFVICPNDISLISLNLSDSNDFVVWKDNMDGKFYGCDLPTREKFSITTYDVITDSINIGGNFVVWKDNRAGTRLYGYDLPGREEFTICPNDVYNESIHLSGDSDYVVWEDNTDMNLYGYNLSTKGRFFISPNVSWLYVSISGDYVVWYDYTGDMNLRGVHIYSIINDECIDAVEVVDDIPYNGSTVGATGTDVSSCAYNDTIDVWHFYEPNAGGQVTITTDGSNFDTTLSVFNACGGTEVACNDDYCLDNTQSKVVISVVKGKTYFIRVAGFNGETGDYQLLVTRGECTEPIKGDLNDDCRVDMLDFAIMASHWLDCNLDPPEACWE
jgi:hypothetical protein